MSRPAWRPGLELQHSGDVGVQGPSVTDQLAQQLHFEATALGCPRPTSARQAARAQGQNPAEQWGLYVDVKPAGVPAGQLNKLEQRLAAASKEQQAGMVLALLLVASADCRCGPRLTPDCQSASRWGLLLVYSIWRQQSKWAPVVGCWVGGSKEKAAGPCGSRQVLSLLYCLGLIFNAESCYFCFTPSRSSPYMHTSHAQHPAKSPWLMQADIVDYPAAIPIEAFVQGICKPQPLAGRSAGQAGAEWLDADGLLSLPANPTVVSV